MPRFNVMILFRDVEDNLCIKEVNGNQYKSSQEAIDKTLEKIEKRNPWLRSRIFKIMAKGM